MKYFKRKDGSVFGKVDWVKQSVIDKYIDDGCVECNEDGSPIKKPSGKKPKAKK